MTLPLNTFEKFRNTLGSALEKTCAELITKHKSIGRIPAIKPFKVSVMTSTQQSIFKWKLCIKIKIFLKSWHILYYKFRDNFLLPDRTVKSCSTILETFLCSTTNCTGQRNWYSFTIFDRKCEDSQASHYNSITYLKKKY